MRKPIFFKYAYAPCYMIVARKERAIEPQPLPDLIRSETKCANQAEARTFSVLPNSRASEIT